MNFDAVQVDVNDILSVNRRYLIPKNQRDFSWKKMQLNEFWSDITDNINFENGVFNLSEYFLGTVVFSGSVDSSVLEIIDGQQRLSVITIIISIISRKLREMEYIDSANDIVDTYLVSKASIISAKAHRTEKIAKSNGRTFFKMKCQSYEDHNPNITCEEDNKINYAYNFFLAKLEKGEACKLLKKSRKGVRYSNEEYISCLDSILRMVTTYLKVVRILVPSTDDAYDVFEVLNARGISLSSVDLIKNKILQYCESDNYPEDTAKKLWSSIEDGLIDLNGNITMPDYVRVWWMSRFGYIGTDQLYRSFKKKIVDLSNEDNPETLLHDMELDSHIFFKICDPQESDWVGIDKIKIFFILKNLHTFNVIIQRPLVFSLLRVRERKETMKLLDESKLIEILQLIEDFQFKFTTICKEKAAGVDAMFARYAAEVSQAKTKQVMNRVLADIKQTLSDKMPSESLFVEKMVNKLWYSKKPNSKRKKNTVDLINYVFVRLEAINRGSGELVMHDTNIEHIGSQSSFDPEYVGMIGNLIPLSKEINDKCGNKPIPQKIPFYCNSDLSTVAEFVSYYRISNDWTNEIVEERSAALAKKLFNNMY